MSGRRRWVRWSGWLAAVLVAGFVVFAAAWRIEGGRWVRVETPSMGGVAPVGTLLWVEPTPFADLQVGDFITFHPPGDPDTTYSHRVYKIDADHTIETKGVIPGPDPWHLTAGDVVGRVQMRWWGVGWLVDAAPVLLIGALVVAFAVSRCRANWKAPVGLVLGALVLTVAVSAYRPFVNASQVAFTRPKSGGADATYVSTGLLPIRVQAHDGPSVVLTDGEVGTVHVATADAAHKLSVRLAPAVPWQFWVLLVLPCLAPGAFVLVRDRWSRRSP